MVPPAISIVSRIFVCVEFGLGQGYGMSLEDDCGEFHLPVEEGQIGGGGGS